jgi:hypothetical protein
MRTLNSKPFMVEPEGIPVEETPLNLIVSFTVSTEKKDWSTTVPAKKSALESPVARSAPLLLDTSSKWRKEVLGITQFPRSPQMG